MLLEFRSACRWMLASTGCLMLVAAMVSPALADGPQDNIEENVRRVPKLGIEVPAAEKAELTEKLQDLAAKIKSVQAIKDPALQSLWPDVAIFHRAVESALVHQEFFSAGQLATAHLLLQEGAARADELLAGNSSWTTATGLVVRGFVSRIDGSVQPYGLVVPDSYVAGSGRRHRLDLWFHGRGETIQELSFLDQRMKQVGRFAPDDTFVLHPYGRYSNAFKFAGEVDVLEGLAHARQHYPIDGDRISARGFSMGGAGCWQIAVHYADRWFAANPGAGFSETPEFLRIFQKEELKPTWYERKLWHLYNATDTAINLYHCPTVAYSGELDIQKQAADIMQQALAKQGIDLLHIIGPGTKHSIHKDSAVEIERRMASLAARGRQRMPRVVHLATYTLKYNRMHWVTIDALDEHWEHAQVDAGIASPSRMRLATRNVAALTLSTPSGWSPFDLLSTPELIIDGQTLKAPQPRSDRSWKCSLVKENGKWRVGVQDETGLRKRHNLQGPIDDAFMDSFVFVRPTGKAAHEDVERWTQRELEHAIDHWRRQFRGDARVKDDTAITDDDIAGMNLVLFGDPASNAVLARLVDKLPITWNQQTIAVGEQRFAAAHHAPALIYPNPLNPRRYVVLNSGFTYREYDYLNNARQVPKLPDWAIVDLRTPVTSRGPGKIVAADFFGEAWQVRPPHEE